ncbi:uncharacterized protein LOC130798940 [Amaranthus tricolor]|uniref:uncharacterized protein LOC130798940 n=1 Tax=Amaranthus tricolor TaxID=29722 RepID=UPI002586D76B|nr:uncharacterized protein LOC130798940 [Amaranthus tricolor]
MTRRPYSQVPLEGCGRHLSAQCRTRVPQYRTCVQETRWKGQKAKGIKGYKLWYLGLDDRRNGVGILVSNDILKQLVEVRRCNDRIMLVRIVLGEEIISIVSAYGPQVGLDEQVQCELWDNLGDLMRTILEDEKVFLGGDFNGHIGNYNSIHGGFGLVTRNESGENLLDFALAKELVIPNSIFKKKDEHLTTYKSGGHATQLDYFLVRKGDRASCLDCKMRKKIVEKKAESRGKIMWGRLKGDMATTLSTKISLLGFSRQSENANEMWTNMAETIRKVAKVTFGVSSGNQKCSKSRGGEMRKWKRR